VSGQNPETEEPEEPELRLRRDALAIFQAALAAVDPARLVREALQESERPAPAQGGRLLLVAVVKAALAMSQGAAEVLGDALSEGVVLAPTGALGAAPPRCRLLHGSHPIPDAEGSRGARQILGLASGAGADDHLLLLLSGGGSALLTLPDGGVTLDDVRRVTELLLRAGAGINELNTVRKHLEVLKGGRLAALAHPAPVTALILSDVVGDPLDVIASGPASPDPTSFADAIAVLRSRGVWGAVPDSVRTHLTRGREGGIAETPKPGDPAFARVRTRIVGNAALSALRAAEKAEQLGYEAFVDSTVVTGEARRVGDAVAARALSLRRLRRAACAVFAGETTVTVRGDGRGGRNQELVLAAALHLDGHPGVLVFSAGTDGLDGPTDAAGALATGLTCSRARGRGLDLSAHLEENDAYTAFDALGDLVKTGPTGTNVMDLTLAMAAGSAATER
jgi:hydroxypyruvate reductase